MQAALMSWLSGADMAESEQLPPSHTPGWDERAIDLADTKAKTIAREVEARFGSADESAIRTYVLAGIAVRALHSLAKQVDALQRATDAGTVAGNDDTVTLADAVKDLQERVQGIEGKGLAYAGTWSRNVTYQHGDIAAHGGALWVASATTTDMPGASAAWQRMLKADLRGQFTAGE